MFVISIQWFIKIDCLENTIIKVNDQPF